MRHLLAALAATVALASGAGEAAAQDEPDPLRSPWVVERALAAELAEVEGRPEAAAEAWRAAAAGPIESGWLLARRALALLKAGAPEEAAEALEEVPATERAAPVVLLARARLALARGRRARALELARRASHELGPTPRPSLVARRLERLLRELGAERDAEALRTAMLGGPARAVAAALHGGDPVLAWERWRRARPALPPWLAVRLARALAAAGRPEAAWRALATIPETTTLSDVVPLRLRLALRTGRHAVAEGLLRGLPPERLGGRLAAARAWLRLGRPALAAELAEVARAVDGAEEGCRLAVEAHLAAGQAAEARRLAPACQPEASTALAALGLASGAAGGPTAPSGEAARKEHRGTRPPPPPRQ